MRFQKFTAPLIILVVGLILIAGVHSFCNIRREPSVTQAEFPFSVTYEMNGKTSTLTGVYTCTYLGQGIPTNPTLRYYKGSYGDNDENGDFHVIAEKDGKQLRVCTPFNPGYLMNDPTHTQPPVAPYLSVKDQYSSNRTDKDILDGFGVTILEWDYPEPIQNTFKFIGIGPISNNSISPMMLAAYLPLLICVFFVTLDRSFCHSDTDILSTAFNYFIAIAFVPFVTLLTKMNALRAPSNDLIFQIQCCIPAFSAMCVAASICLRRKGCAVSSLVVQFFGPAAYIVCLLLEAKL